MKWRAFGRTPQWVRLSEWLGLSLRAPDFAVELTGFTVFPLPAKEGFFDCSQQNRGKSHSWMGPVVELLAKAMADSLAADRN